jgi:hypothetical protein
MRNLLNGDEETLSFGELRFPSGLRLLRGLQAIEVSEKRNFVGEGFYVDKPSITIVGNFGHRASRIFDRDLIGSAHGSTLRRIQYLGAVVV